MRKTCLQMVHELARRDERVLFVGSDLGPDTLQEFRAEFPGRFFMEGVTEQSLIGIAAGLAMEGKIPYVNTIGTFITRRCFEQVALDLCLHNQNVRLIGNGGGLVYAPLGPTHLAIDDLAILRALPNMAILAPADAEEMRRIMPLTLDWRGPVYIRLAKGGDEVASLPGTPAAIGEAVPVREGGDALLVTTGVALQPALGAAERLSREGLEAAVLHCPTVKPLDAPRLLAAIRRVPVVVTVEEHSIIGGLGSAVAELLAESGLGPKAFRRVGIPDVFPEQYGSQAEEMADYGISPEGIAGTVRALPAGGDGR